MSITVDKKVVEKTEDRFTPTEFFQTLNTALQVPSDLARVAIVGPKLEDPDIALIHELSVTLTVPSFVRWLKTENNYGYLTHFFRKSHRVTAYISIREDDESYLVVEIKLYLHNQKDPCGKIVCLCRKNAAWLLDGKFHKGKA